MSRLTMYTQKYIRELIFLNQDNDQIGHQFAITKI